jgi:hypothetical protein
VPGAVDAIEIANGAPSAREQAMAIWDTLLRAGRHVTAVAGRDWHRGTTPLGHPAVRVWAEELSRPAILEAIRRGRVVVLDTAALPAPELEAAARGRRARIGDTLAVPHHTDVEVTLATTASAYAGARIDLLWNGEPVASTSVVDRAVFVRHPEASGYLRAQIVGPTGTLLAVTNPIYVIVG